MPQVLQDFIQILVSGIVDLAQGIASGVVAMAKALFLEVSVDSTTHVETVTGLSVFGGIVAIFAKHLKSGEVKLRKIGEGFNTNTELICSIA